ncbi:MAG: MoaD/ThiS family protein [Chloroflexi bacterium]|jgi:molybdopterin synthase sulfur carrier subunit|nr:MoaD/ThiS family protein [Chloroflexota bacterium]
MIRVTLPTHLRNLAHVGSEVSFAIQGPVTAGAVLDALEQAYPVLGGTLRDYQSGQLRPFIRLFACGQDLSHEPMEATLPAQVARGEEPLRIVGAMAGG